MAYKIVIKKRFTNKVINVLSYLEKEWGGNVPREFLVILDSKLNALQKHPRIGGLTNIKNVRGIHVTKHNRMYYKVEGNTITVLNLFDTRRKNYRK